MSPATGEHVEGRNALANGRVSCLNSQDREQPVSRRPQQRLKTNYPSQSLRFLQHISSQSSRNNSATSRPQCPTPARLRLNILVVGAGLGGLAAAIALARKGHSVRVLEQAPELGEVGAGIQIPPNSGRLLNRWGVYEHLEKWAVTPQGINIRRWENGQIIGYTALGEKFRSDFEVPYYVVHRAHFHAAMHQRAKELGVIIELNKKVIGYDEGKGLVVLENGALAQGDLVVASDGIKSLARQTAQPNVHHEPEFNGFAAYRATVDVRKMKEDPDIAWILERPDINLWIGEDRHVMAYQITAGESFNMVLSHVDLSDPSTWTTKFAKEHIQAEFSAWDPKLTKILSLIDSCMKWPLKVGRQLRSWSSPSSKLIIIGDAAHAMLPYMSQGAAMAVEDGAALAVVLDQISSLSELPFALRTFEKERIKRSGNMMDASTMNGVIWHFPDGPEQQARDASMMAEVNGLPFTSSANQWTDPVTYWWAYGYDAEQAMEEAWKRAVSDLICSNEHGR